MTNMRHIQQRNQGGFKRNQGGFTIVELLIVIGILGVAYAMYSGLAGAGSTAQARASEKMAIATRGTMIWSQVVASTGVSPSVTGSALIDGTGDALDVLVEGVDAVASAYKGPYQQSGATTISDSLQINASSYTLNGASVVTIEEGTDGATDARWVFTETTEDEIAALASKYEPDDYDPSTNSISGTSNTTGMIQWTGCASGVCTLKINRNIR